MHRGGGGAPSLWGQHGCLGPSLAACAPTKLAQQCSERRVPPCLLAACLQCPPRHLRYHAAHSRAQAPAHVSKAPLRSSSQPHALHAQALTGKRPSLVRNHAGTSSSSAHAPTDGPDGPQQHPALINVVCGGHKAERRGTTAEALAAHQPTPCSFPRSTNQPHQPTPCTSLLPFPAPGNGGVAVGLCAG